MKKLRGFTLTELLVVMAMTAIMISVTMVSLGGARDKKAVETEARKFAATIREAQNYALTGKQLGSGQLTCQVGVGSVGADETGYVMNYKYRTGVDCSIMSGDQIMTNNALLNGVSFASDVSAFYFTVPHGNLSFTGTRQIEFQKNTARAYVCIYSEGRIEEAVCP